MRIKVLVNLGSEWPPFHQDEIQDVTEDLGRSLIDNYLAIELAVDKFEQIRQHPDHLTQKPAATRKRTSKNETKSQGA
jgi:hypothetical protein